MVKYVFFYFDVKLKFVFISNFNIIWSQIFKINKYNFSKLIVLIFFLIRQTHMVLLFELFNCLISSSSNVNLKYYLTNLKKLASLG